MRPEDAGFNQALAIGHAAANPCRKLGCAGRHRSTLIAIQPSLSEQPVRADDRQRLTGGRLGKPVLEAFLELLELGEPWDRILDTVVELCERDERLAVGEH